MTGVATGTEVDNSLFRTSRTCLELTAIGNSTGASVRQKEVETFQSNVLCEELNTEHYVSQNVVAFGQHYTVTHCDSVSLVIHYQLNTDLQIVLCGRPPQFHQLVEVRESCRSPLGAECPPPPQ